MKSSSRCQSWMQGLKCNILKEIFYIKIIYEFQPAIYAKDHNDW